MTSLFHPTGNVTPPLRGGFPTYNVFLGGSATGTATDGLYQNPTYTAGTKNSSLTVASVVTKVNSR